VKGGRAGVRGVGRVRQVAVVGELGVGLGGLLADVELVDLAGRVHTEPGPGGLVPCLGVGVVEVARFGEELVVHFLMSTVWMR